MRVPVHSNIVIKIAEQYGDDYRLVVDGALMPFGGYVSLSLSRCVTKSHIIMRNTFFSRRKKNTFSPFDLR